jgi:hypothetical protein
MTAILGDSSWVFHTLEHADACLDVEGLANARASLLGALTPGERCEWSDVLTDGGGIGAAAAVAVVVAIGVGAIASTTVGLGLAIAGAVAAVAYTAYFIYKKNCTEVRCISACQGGGGGGTCVGALSCVCDDDLEEALAWGDPHVVSYDGLYFDFQGAGEYVVAESTAGAPLMVQVRQEPSTSGRCATVSIHTAVAMRVGASRVAFDVNDPDGPLRIDGDPVELPGDYLELPTGGTISRSADRPNRYIVRFPAGEVAEVEVRAVNIDLYLKLPPTRLGQVRGVWGTWDGDASNEITTRSGVVLTEPVEFDAFYGDFAESWRVQPEETLFDYAPGDDTDTFTIPDFPGRPAGLDEADAAAARQVCTDAGVTDPVLLEACAVDVHCMADGSFADAFVGVDYDRALDRPSPVYLDGWTQEGEPANGTWQVSADGRSVTQTVNGDPTFFVSNKDYIDTTIRGTLETTDADDDFMGFAFGYRGPFASAGDAPDEYDTFVVAWKRAAQDFGSSGLAPEGLTLARVVGQPDAAGTASFWNQQSTATYQVLDTDWGAGTGWRYRPHSFELTYTRDRIEVLIDGEVRLSATAADAGLAEFPSGRFGFYNYSQEQVVYSNFSATTTPRPSTDLRVSPRRTYLRTSADAAFDASPVSLELRGFQPGDPLTLERVGEWDGNPPDPRSQIAVFSSTPELLTSDQLDRVASAIDAGADVATPATFDRSLPTDIAEDFAVQESSADGNLVTLIVPAGARYVWFSTIDSLFDDNADLDRDFGVRLLSGPPEPAAPVARSADVAVTDSIVDFSLSQGDAGWEYGWVDATNQSAFQQMPVDDGDGWVVDAANANTRIDRSTMTPQAASGGLDEHQPVRRWVSTVNGPATIRGAVRKAATGGDGVTARLVVDGFERWSQTIASSDVTTRTFEVSAALGVGSTVDLVLESGATDVADTTHFNATVLERRFGDVFLVDDFDDENGGVAQLDYSDFQNWTPTGGGVDIVGNGGFFDYDLYNGSQARDGLLVDLSETSAGGLTSIREFTLEPGEYLVQLDMVGAFDTSSDSYDVTIALGAPRVRTFSVPARLPFATYTQRWTVTSRSTARLEIVHSPVGFDGTRIDDVLFMRLGR